MEVVLQLPDDLVKYVEYIPAVSLPDVLVEVIRDGMALKDCGSKEAEGSINSESVMSMLSELLSAGNKQASYSKGNAGQEPVQGIQDMVEEPEGNAVQSVFINTESDSESDSDSGIDDFMDLMK